ncbi:MAG TPA: GNAT family N-acetyltransferase [Casimicrobiaceae bacterium]|nr:GNAT family N-acetyltransferase [Casimicrobiaceae bacterium]
MTTPLAYLRNRASEADIAAHLRRCDEAFVPALGTRVDIDDYAQKLASRSVRFEAWHDELVGLLAVYCNDEARQLAFITSISVLPHWRRRGIASHLLHDCVRYLRQGGFAQVQLEVDARNAAAVAMYARHGFAAVGHRDASAADHGRDATHVDATTMVLTLEASVE